LWNGGRLGAQQSRWFFRASDQTDRRAKIAGDNSAGNSSGVGVAENARSDGMNWRRKSNRSNARRPSSRVAIADEGPHPCQRVTQSSLCDQYSLGEAL